MKDSLTYKKLVTDPNIDDTVATSSYFINDTLLANTSYQYDTFKRIGNHIINFNSKSLKKVGLYEKIMTFPNGINTILTKEFSNEGIELSGGERQKLAVARVFASRSQIAILDEPTSALDPYSEKEINDDIIKMVDTKIVIIISHRLSTIVNVDRIYVMKDGKIEEYGTHDELMKQNGIYYEMFTVQAELYKE